MFTLIILNVISTTMLFMMLWMVINITKLDKKYSVIQNIQQMLNGFFLPLLGFVKGILPKTKLDFSPLALMMFFWTIQKILIAMQ